MLIFEWDDDKAESNFAKHGISFPDARDVFNDPLAIEGEDRSLTYGEIRWRIIGTGKGRVLTVIYTEREDTIRLISARKSTRAERHEYHNAKR